MKSLTLMSQDKKEVNVESEEIRNMIESFNSVQEARDVSNAMNQDVFGYYVVLDSSFIEDELGDEAEDLEYGYDEEEISAAVIEQAEYICDALVDNLKEFVQNRFGIEEFHTAYDLGTVDMKDGIGFTITVSFGQVQHGKLYELASSINERQSFK